MLKQNKYVSRNPSLKAFSTVQAQIKVKKRVNSSQTPLPLRASASVKEDLNHYNDQTVAGGKSSKLRINRASHQEISQGSVVVTGGSGEHMSQDYAA